jgi:predicted nucleic acid-binding protein
LNLFILDCSVTMSWCLENEKNKDSEQALYLLAKKKAIVPCIWTLEVINVLRVAERQNRISSADSNTFISLLNTFPIEVDVNSDSLNRKILDIIREHALSAYDAAYLELAIKYNAPLASFDKLLNKVAKKEGVEVLFQ